MSKISTVDTSVGDGEQWMVTYRPVPERARLGVVPSRGLRPRRRHPELPDRGDDAGQDYNYERGHEPIDEALRVAADRLLATR